MAINFRKHALIVLSASPFFLAACSNEDAVKTAPQIDAPAMSLPTPPAPIAANAPNGTIILVDADKKAEYIEKMKLLGKKSIKGEDCVQVCMESDSLDQCHYTIGHNGCYVDSNVRMSTDR